MHILISTRTRVFFVPDLYPGFRNTRTGFYEYLKLGFRNVCTLIIFIGGALSHIERIRPSGCINKILGYSLYHQLVLEWNPIDFNMVSEPRLYVSSG
ncbi:hypothetical protein HanIR_Chr14g0724191 [Helianthus annuus]|nr:hypothetical protein HanIR_Chr14g0724191 [Helianthus annuus]